MLEQNFKMEYLSFTSVLRHISETFLSLNNILSYYLLIANYMLNIPSQVSSWNFYNVGFIICILWLRKEEEKLHKLPQNHIINGIVEMGSCISQHSKHRFLIIILFCLKKQKRNEVGNLSSAQYGYCAEICDTVLFTRQGRGLSKIAE